MTVRIGRLEIAFGIVLAVYIVLALADVTGPFRAIGQASPFGSGLLASQSAFPE